MAGEPRLKTKCSLRSRRQEANVSFSPTVAQCQTTRPKNGLPRPELWWIRQHKRCCTEILLLNSIAARNHFGSALLLPPGTVQVACTISLQATGFIQLDAMT